MALTARISDSKPRLLASGKSVGSSFCEPVPRTLYKPPRRCSILSKEVRVRVRQAVLVVLARRSPSRPLRRPVPTRRSNEWRSSATAARRIQTPPDSSSPYGRDASSATQGRKWSSERRARRDAWRQRVSIYDSIVETFKGKRGTLVIRSRIEYVEAGSGYHVGTGTWKVVRGTGQYARIAGGGGEAMSTWTAGHGAPAARASSPFGSAAYESRRRARARVSSTRPAQIAGT